MSGLTYPACSCGETSCLVTATFGEHVVGHILVCPLCGETGMLKWVRENHLQCLRAFDRTLVAINELPEAVL